MSPGLMWFGTALSEMVRLKFEITLHGRVNEITLKTHINTHTDTQSLLLMFRTTA